MDFSILFQIQAPEASNEEQPMSDSDDEGGKLTFFHGR